MNKIVFSALVVFFLAAIGANALKCYKCDESVVIGGKSCKDLQETDQVDCHSTEERCFRYGEAISALECYQCIGGTSCAELDSNKVALCPDSTLCFKVGENESRMHGCVGAGITHNQFCNPGGLALPNCETCNTDRCNSSATVLASAALVAVSAILLKMYN